MQFLHNTLTLDSVVCNFYIHVRYCISHCYMACIATTYTITLHNSPFHIVVHWIQVTHRALHCYESVRLHWSSHHLKRKHNGWAFRCEWSAAYNGLFNQRIPSIFCRKQHKHVIMHAHATYHFCLPSASSSFSWSTPPMPLHMPWPIWQGQYLVQWQQPVLGWGCLGAGLHLGHYWNSTGVFEYKEARTPLGWCGSLSQ